MTVKLSGQGLSLFELAGVPVQTFTSLDSTPSIGNGHAFDTAGSTTIVRFDDSTQGQTIAIRATGPITLQHNANILLVGDVDFIMVTGDVVTLSRFDATEVFVEVSRRQVSSGGGAGSDTTAIHDDTSGEINAITAKGAPVGADMLVIEDSADSFSKKKVAIADLPGGGGGAADSLATTGADVVVSTAAPPAAGQSLVAISSTAAEWGDITGGAVAAAQGAYIHAKLSVDHDNPAIGDAVAFDIVVNSRGELSVDGAGKISGLKAGRTYQAISTLRIEDGSTDSMFSQWYDVTGSPVAIGTQAFHYPVTAGSPASQQPVASALISPTVDTDIELRVTARFNLPDVQADVSFVQVVEIGAVQANVVGGLEFMDIIEVTADAQDVTFGSSGDGTLQRALDGDVDHEYFLDYYIPDPGATAVFSLRPNNAAATYDGIRVFNGTGGGITDLRLATLVSGDIGGGQGTLQAETGRNRIWNANAYRSGASDFALQYGGAYQESATNIDSLVVHSDVAATIKVGARFVLWRRTRNNLRADSAAVYERMAMETVDPGALATTERTVGHSIYGGSLVGVSLRVEDAVTAGNITVNIKLDGVTALTAVLDTTNSTSHVVRAAIGVHKFAADKNISVEFVPTGYDNAGSIASAVTAQVHLTNDALITRNDRVVARTELSANATTLALTDLDGDLDGVYEIEGCLLGVLGTTQTLKAGFNGDGGASLRTRRIDDGTSSGAALGGDLVTTGASATTQEYAFHGKIFAQRDIAGVTRFRAMQLDIVQAYDLFSKITATHVSAVFEDSADNLTSVEFISSVATSLRAGSWAEIRRTKA